METSLARSRAAAVRIGQTIRRTFYETLQGPYTSVILTNGDGVASSVRVSERLALSIAAVYRSLAIYSDEIGTMPIARYSGTEKLDLPAFVRAPAGIEIGWTDEIGMLLWSLLLRGDAYALPTAWGFDGYPTAFSVLDPNRVDVAAATDTGRPVYRYRFGNGTPDLVLYAPPAQQLLHIRWQRPPGSLCGVGILDANAYPGGTLGGAWAANYFASDLLANPSPPAVLTHPMRLSQTQAEALQEQWTTSVGRSRSVPAVLSGGITFAPLQISARDAQLIEQMRWHATEIATMFGLPPYMVGGSTGDSLTYSTVEGENTRLWTQALQPMSVRLERAFSAWVPRGQTLRFNPDALLRSQTLDRYNAHEIALRAGFETVDEVRELEHRPPLVAPAPPPPAIPPAPQEVPV